MSEEEYKLNMNQLNVTSILFREQFMGNMHMITIRIIPWLMELVKDYIDINMKQKEWKELWIGVIIRMTKKLLKEEWKLYMHKENYHNEYNRLIDINNILITFFNNLSREYFSSFFIKITNSNNKNFTDQTILWYIIFVNISSQVF